MFSPAALLLVITLGERIGQEFFAGVARPYVEADVRARRGVSEIPPNVTLSGGLRRTVDLMLQRSVTFRQQCSRIGRARHLAVTLQYGPGIGRFARGVTITKVTRRADGRIEAIVDLATLDNHVELIAHEFEHVLEQVDGVDLPAMAARPATGVRLAGADGHFETERAIAIGRQVAGEAANARQ